jgi:hypothetical protein
MFNPFSFLKKEEPKVQEIIFAFEHWNDQYQWYHPNTVPLDFEINGVKKLPATHEFMWFELDTIPDWETQDSKWFGNSARKNDMLSSSVTYKKLSDIPANSKYIFPVLCPATSYFRRHETVGFQYVGNRVIEDVRNGLAKIVFCCPNEGNSGTNTNSRDFDILDNWCRFFNFNKEQVYYIHGNLKGPVNAENFTYVPIDSFPNWLPMVFDSPIKFVPVSEKNLFLCYNRRPHRHRCNMVSALLKEKLFDRGLISFGKDPRTDPTRVVYQHLREESKILHKMSPITLDIDDLILNNPANFVVPGHHEQTFLSLVNETTTDPNTIFFSEKIYKPISIGQPFLLFSSWLSLRKLKDMGYQTFSDWWHEGYDDYPNEIDRMEAIIEQLKQLSNLSVADLEKMHNEMIPVLEHNQNVFYETKKKHKIPNSGLSDPLYAKINDIWSTLC